MHPPPAPPDFYLVLYILGSLVLVGLNGFFVAAEFAIVKVRRTRLEELAGKGVQAARVSILCVDQLDEYLSATQLGITVVSLGLGWIGEASFHRLFLLFIPELSAHPGATHTIALVLSFLVITLLHVVLGELVPKSMAIQRAEAVTLWVTRPLRWFYIAAKPAINGFTWLANLILKLLGFHNAEEEPLSEEELKLVMKESKEEGVISESEAQIITKAFSFSDKRVGEIMVPASKALYLSLDRTIEENLATVKQRMYTRFPLARTGLDSLIGVVHMKDAWRELAEDMNNEAFVKTARPAVFVDPGLRQDALMKILKEKRTHLAIVHDPESLEVLGIVTLEDILEELVGDIRDEHGN